MFRLLFYVYTAGKNDLKHAVFAAKARIYYFVVFVSILRTTVMQYHPLIVPSGVVELSKRFVKPYERGAGGIDGVARSGAWNGGGIRNCNHTQTHTQHLKTSTTVQLLSVAN